MRPFLIFIALIVSVNIYGTTLGVIDPNPVNYRNAVVSTTMTVRSRTDSTASRYHIYIYDLSGRLVRQFKQDTYSSSDFNVTWDLKNSAGRLVVTGVYIVLFVRSSSDGKRDQGRLRMAVIR